jgi:outer membrane protein assembly factor BamB
MWECRKCHERLEDSFEVCWNCGTSKEGVEDPTFGKVEEGEKASEADALSIPAGQRKVRARGRASARTIAQLIYVGLNGYALALDRDTGEIVWSNKEMRSGYVSLLLDGDRLIVSTNGYMYCLDPLTGRIRWHNPLKGYGRGAPTSLISARGQSSANLIQQAADDVAGSSSD